MCCQARGCPAVGGRPVDPSQLPKYLLYLQAVPARFAELERPCGDLSGMITALVQARRFAREAAGLSESEVEAAAQAVAWAREHAAEIEAAETLAEAPFLSAGERARPRE